MTNRYSIYPSSFVAGEDTLDLQQILTADPAPGSKVDSTTPGGALDPAVHMLGSGDPRVRLSTHDLATVLAAVSVSAGLYCSGGATIRRQVRELGGGFGTTGVTYVSTLGFLYVASIACQQGQPATCELEYVALYDGTNAPLAPNAAVSLSDAPAPSFVSKYFLGPVYCGATQYAGIQSVQINPGVQFSPVLADGDVFARTGSIVSRAPSVTFTTLKEDLASIIGSMHMASLASALKIYLLAGAEGSTARVSAASSAHVKLTVATGAWNIDRASVQDQGDGTLSVTVPVTGTLASSIASTVP